MGEQAQRDLARGGGFRRDGSQFLCRPFGWIARERSQNVLQTIAREQPGNQRPVPLDPRRGRYHVAGPQELVDIVRLCSDRGLYARERRRRQIMARQPPVEAFPAVQPGDRKSVVEGKEGAVRVEYGWCRYIKKK